jgi:hypothetical protein
VLERLEKIERAVELKGLGQPQAEIDKKQAAPVASLLKAVEKIPKAAIQAGSILLVKLIKRSYNSTSNSHTKRIDLPGK